MHARSVRVVGTNALRVARRKQAFLERAREALGHPIEIISGMEEARLIYSGVAHSMPSEAGRRLVIDIGGGSTELIIGEGLTPLELESLQMGCVALSRKILPRRQDHRRSVSIAPAWPRASSSSRCRRRSAVAAGRARAGSSGTVRAIGEAIREIDPTQTAITRDGLKRVLDYMVKQGSTRDLNLAAITDERRAVFPGGMAILTEVFDVLGIESMRIADGAMRDGLLYDIVGRYTDEDARERSVRSMQERYHVDLAQAERVEATVANFLARTRSGLEARRPAGRSDSQVGRATARDRARRLAQRLSPARRVSARERGYAGFPKEEQQLLARLVGGHRRKLSLERLDELVPPWDKDAVYLIVLLRLAVLLHRGRSAAALPDIDLDRARPHARSEVSGSVAEGSSVDHGGSAAGNRSPEAARLQAARAQRAADAAHSLKA